MILPDLLHVDDSQDSLLLFRDVLARSALRVNLQQAASVPDAVRALTQPRPRSSCAFRCLVVLDLELPGLGGVAFLRTIRPLYPTSEVPIVVLTGARRPEHASLSTTYGISDVMQKPIDSLDLLKWINTLQRFLPNGRSDPTCS